MVRRVQSRPPTTIELPPMKKQCPSPPPPRPTLKMIPAPERPIIHSGNREEMYRKVVCRCGKAPCQSPCGKCPLNDWILRTSYDAMRKVSPVSPGSEYDVSPISPGSVSSGSEYDVSPLSDSQESPDPNAPTSPTIPPSVSPEYRADSPIYYMG